MKEVYQDDLSKIVESLVNKKFTRPILNRAYRSCFGADRVGSQLLVKVNWSVSKSDQLGLNWSDSLMTGSLRYLWGVKKVLCTKHKHIFIMEQENTKEIQRNDKLRKKFKLKITRQFLNKNKNKNYKNIYEGERWEKIVASEGARVKAERGRWASDGNRERERVEGCFLVLLSSPDLVAIPGSERETMETRERWGLFPPICFRYHESYDGLERSGGWFVRVEESEGWRSGGWFVEWWRIVRVEERSEGMREWMREGEQNWLGLGLGRRANRFEWGLNGEERGLWESWTFLV